MLNEINVLWGSVAAKVVYYFWIHDGFPTLRILGGRRKHTEQEMEFKKSDIETS